MKGFFKNVWEHRFQICILVVAICGISIVYYYFKDEKDVLYDMGEKEKPFYLVNIIVALAAVATAIFTWWKNTLSKEQVKVAQGQMREQIEQTKNAQRQIEVQEDIRLDSLFAKAIELIKENNDLITRKGGVHILKDLAITSPKHTQKCIDMLCSLNETWMPEILSQNMNFFESNWINNTILDNKSKEILKSQNTDFKKLVNKVFLSQTVLNHLSSIIKYVSTNDNFKDVYNLSHKYLCSISINDTNFSKFKLSNVFLNGAFFNNCNLEQVEMRGSNLTGMHFFNSNLNGANLEYSYLNNISISTCDLEGTNISHSYLIGAFIIRGNFKGANLDFSHFEKSNLTSCNFECSNLCSTNFVGANFSYPSFQNSIMFSTKLRGSTFLQFPDDTPNVLSYNKNEDKIDDFEKSQEEFIIWLEDDFLKRTKGKITNVYKENMLQAYKNYHSTTNLQFPANFKINEKADSIFLSNIDEYAKNKIICRSILQRYSFADDNVSDVFFKVKQRIVNNLKNNNVVWYNDFKKENIIYAFE